MDIRIETADIIDAEMILELQKHAFMGQARIYDNDQLPPLTQTLESLKSEFQTATVLKAVHENRIIGSVRYFKDKDGIHINRLVVHPDCQNKGVGTRLMKNLENRFEENERFHLFTGEKSIRNIHLYTHLGYHVVRREETPIGIVHLHMEKVNQSIVKEEN